jgi:hypothetical protein
LGSGAKQGGPASQFIGVCQSIKGQVELMAREVEVFSPETFIRHLVNVRPFGFQPSPPRQTSVKQLPTLARDFDHVWIVAGQGIGSAEPAAIATDSLSVTQPPGWCAACLRL